MIQKWEKFGIPKNLIQKHAVLKKGKICMSKKSVTGFADKIDRTIKTGRCGGGW
jgi:hypothetical protein